MSKQQSSLRLSTYVCVRRLRLLERKKRRRLLAEFSPSNRHGRGLFVAWVRDLLKSEPRP